MPDSHFSAPTGDTADRAAPPFQPLTVMVAAHARSSRSDVDVVLETGGLDVVARASDSSSAVRYALEYQPQICLIDADLPGGVVGAVAAIVAHLPETRIGMLADFTTDQRAVRAVQAGADGILLASAPADALLDDAQLLARGELALPPEVTAELAASAQVELRVDQPQPSRIGSSLLYLPRFSRHLWRRLRAGMSLAVAWTSARDRMTEYW